MKTYMAVYFGAALVAMCCLPVVSRLAKMYCLVDSPGPRKIHRIPVPRVGGIVFLLATLTLVLPVFFLDNRIGNSFRQARTEFVVLLLAASFVFAVGLLDDLRPVRGHIKLLLLVVASLALAASGARIDSISIGSNLEIEFGVLAWPLTVLWVVTITVGMNLIDGLDGLAAGIAAIVCGTLVILAMWSDYAAMAVLMLALLGSVTGFLFFNFHPAKIFMGDGGSMFLGFMIAGSSLVCQVKTQTLAGLAVPFMVLGVPILDMGEAVVRRGLLERRSIFASDRKHLHHRLLDLGMRQRTVVLVICAMTAISASISILILTTDGLWPVWLLTLGLVVAIAMFILLPGRHSGAVRHTLRRNLSIANQARAERRTFENAQLRMGESASLHEWWATLCSMSETMRFSSIELWRRDNGSFHRDRSWTTPSTEDQNDAINVVLPVGGDGAGQWQVRASIQADGCLELSGRQTMLLGRLMDEFPPPRAVARPVETPVASRTELPEPLDILGIPVTPLQSYDHALACIETIVESNRKTFWAAVNPMKSYNAWHDDKLLELMRSVDVGICDGVGISVASAILYGRPISRCTGCDLFFRLLSLAREKKWRIYLLGGCSRSNAATSMKLQETYPGLNVVGRRDGFFDFNNCGDVIESINKSRADLLFVAMGSPKQEFWIKRHRHLIDAGFCMGVGGSFDVAAGALKRAPALFRATGTEFLYRFLREPRKRWPNQKILMLYLLTVLRARLFGFRIRTGAAPNRPSAIGGPLAADGGIPIETYRPDGQSKSGAKTSEQSNQPH